MNGRHSIDKMDTINFLLTEVSLGLLGNNFFDIHGNSIESLNTLVSKCSSKSSQTTTSEVPLLKKIKLSESNFSLQKGRLVQKSKISNAEPYRKPDKLRRLSHSDMPANATPTVDIPLKPQCAKIRTRRSTCIGERSILINAVTQQPLPGTENKLMVLKPSAANASRPLQPLEKLQQDLKIGYFHFILDICMSKMNVRTK